jgi:hypothetical protein
LEKGPARVAFNSFSFAYSAAGAGVSTAAESTGASSTGAVVSSSTTVVVVSSVAFSAGLLVQALNATIATNDANNTIFFISFTIKND